MRKIVPYRSVEGLCRALDNGGRWYHFFDLANDGKISEAELAKGAGCAFHAKDIFLFLALATSQLGQTEYEIVESKLALPIRLKNRRYAPRQIQPSDIESTAEGDARVIVRGQCIKQVKTRSLCLPRLVSMTGLPRTIPTHTIALVPLTDLFRVYEFADLSGDSKATTLIGVKRRYKLPLGQPLTIAALVHELSFQGKAPSHHFLCQGFYCLEEQVGDHTLGNANDV